MKAALRTQLGQQLNLTPQLLQSIRLLHLNALEIELEVNRALDENPLLECVESGEDGASDADVEDPQTGDEAADNTSDIDEFPDEVDYVESGPRSSGDDDDPLARCVARETGDTRQRVLANLGLEMKEPGDLAVAAWLVDHIDDAGYLELPLDALAARAQAELGTEAERLMSVRARMLRGDPPGYGACDLRECLLVQLELHGANEASRELALRIVGDHLALLGSHGNRAIAEQLGVPLAEVSAAVRLILTLDPKPGAERSVPSGLAVVPDVVVRRRGKGWHVALNSRTAPLVRINAAYEQMLSRAPDDAGARRLRDLLQEARWLTRGLAMRYDTLLRTTRAIVERQAEFFERGEESMRPLTLREIADAIGMHESSISRITTGKYVQTPRGTFELKYFFSGRLSGAAVAGVAVRAMVKRLIDSENSDAPLADDVIVTLLARQGIQIARRTVAKYREIMNIASAKDRRRPSTTAA